MSIAFKQDGNSSNGPVAKSGQVLTSPDKFCIIVAQGPQKLKTVLIVEHKLGPIQSQTVSVLAKSVTVSGQPCFAGEPLLL